MLKNVALNAWKGIFFKHRKADGEPLEIAAGWCGCTANVFVTSSL